MMAGADGAAALGGRVSTLDQKLLTFLRSLADVMGARAGRRDD